MLTIRIVFASLLWVAICPVSAWAQPWPKGEWPHKSLKDAGFREKDFSLFTRYAFNPPANFSTDSVVVIKDGYLVYEQYAHDYQPTQKHALSSMTKSLQNAMVGILEFKGLMNRSTPVSAYYPRVGSYRGQVPTIDDLLRMSSGMDWDEEDKHDFFKSDPLKFYHLQNFQDMAAFVAKHGFIHPPGQNFSYSTGDATLLSAAIRGAIGESDYDEFPWREVFDKLGMGPVTVERDPSNLMGFEGLAYMSTRDMARLGLLYLRHGVVDGEKLWPSDWLEYTSTMAPAQLNPPDPNDPNVENDQSYGAHFWLNKKRPEDQHIPYPDLPEDVLFGLGLRGQYLLIMPSENAILVRTGSDTELFGSAREYFRKELFRKFYESFKKEKKK